MMKKTKRKLGNYLIINTKQPIFVIRKINFQASYKAKKLLTDLSFALSINSGKLIFLEPPTYFHFSFEYISKVERLTPYV